MELSKTDSTGFVVGKPKLFEELFSVLSTPLTVLAQHILSESSLDKSYSPLKERHF